MVHSLWYDRLDQCISKKITRCLKKYKPNEFGFTSQVQWSWFVAQMSAWTDPSLEPTTSCSDYRCLCWSCDAICCRRPGCCAKPRPVVTSHTVRCLCRHLPMVWEAWQWPEESAVATDGERRTNDIDLDKERILRLKLAFLQIKTKNSYSWC